MTLIVSPSFDGSHADWFERLPEPKVRVDTSAGGYPSGALIDTYRFERRHDSYLLVQDTMEPTQDDVVAPFVEAARKARSPVCVWARFPMFFDNPDQQHWVEAQYPYVPKPEFGVFGPVFWVERKVLDRLDRYGRLPRKPRHKNEANGTERAWAYAFDLLGIKPAHLWDWSTEHLESGDALPFKKLYAGRQ